MHFVGEQGSKNCLKDSFVAPWGRYASSMKVISPDQLAYVLRGEAKRMGGAASALLSNVQYALGITFKNGMGSPEVELRCISKFARDHGFKYLSLTTRSGQKVCNFWLDAND